MTLPCGNEYFLNQQRAALHTESCRSLAPSSHLPHLAVRTLGRRLRRAGAAHTRDAEDEAEGKKEERDKCRQK